MFDNFEDNCNVTPEQEKFWVALGDLKNAFEQLIATERSNALDSLLNKGNSADEKQKSLHKYFSFRMSPSNYTVILSDGKEYDFSFYQDVADKLFNDSTFIHRDEDLILNSFNFFYESIITDDVVLAQHYHRLSHSDESLSCLSKTVAYYAQEAFDTTTLDLNCTIPKPEQHLSHEEAVNLMRNILSFVDQFLSEYVPKRGQYSQCFDLLDDKKLDFSSRIGRNACQSMAKTDAVEIRIKKLYDYLCSCKGYIHDCNIDFELENILLPNLYKNWGITVDAIRNHPDEMVYPTFADLVEFTTEQKYIGRPSCAYSFLGNLLTTEERVYFDQNTAVTEDDLNEAQERNKQVDMLIAYEIISSNIHYLFVIINCAQLIPELSDEKMRRRSSICRQLCDIFSDYEAYEIINDDEKINFSKLVIAEERAKNKEERAKKKIAEHKAKLFETFLCAFSSSPVEKLMEQRRELLKQARGLSPKDLHFLEECSEKISLRMQDSIDAESIKPFEEQVRQFFVCNKASLLSDNVLHSLATAEFLFSKYANEQYAAEGFDYSSISALYYQAFENAYNELIWSKYASFLNNEFIIGDAHYTALLNKCHKHHNKGSVDKHSPIFGFLPELESNWQYYTIFDKSTGCLTINKTCMYASFLRFIGGGEKPYSQEELIGFYKWLANQFGFTGFTEMMNNKIFIKKFDSFRSEMSVAVLKRNEASHGSSEIRIEQCKNDRDTILSDLRKIRENKLGLIQQLVDLFNIVKL